MTESFSVLTNSALNEAYKIEVQKLFSHAWVDVSEGTTLSEALDHFDRKMRALQDLFEATVDQEKGI